MKTLNAKLNKRERRAQQLLAHYATCERLARYLGVATPDGKKISVALWKIERDASNAACARCNGETVNGQPFRNEENWEHFKRSIEHQVSGVFVGHGVPRIPGFFVNGDPRGYALKIDNENPEGHAIIEAVKLHTDMGGYGILSPEIDGE